MSGPEPPVDTPDSRPCPTGTLVGQASTGVYYVPARCQRWACPTCSRTLARRLAKRIAKANPNRFLTLTIRADPDADPQAQLDAMNLAWRALWKRLQRRYPRSRMAYVRIVELTKAGTPHLHLALQSPYIPQRWLSAQWDDLTGSSIVDIRRVRSVGGLAHYLAKYVTKSAEHVEGRRKWSATRAYLPPSERDRHPDCINVYAWTYSRRNTEEMLASFSSAGWELEGRFIADGAGHW